MRNAKSSAALCLLWGTQCSFIDTPSDTELRSASMDFRFGGRLREGAGGGARGAGGPYEQEQWAGHKQEQWGCPFSCHETMWHHSIPSPWTRGRDMRTATPTAVSYWGGALAWGVGAGGGTGRVLLGGSSACALVMRVSCTTSLSHHLSKEEVGAQPHLQQGHIVWWHGLQSPGPQSWSLGFCRVSICVNDRRFRRTKREKEFLMIFVLSKFQSSTVLSL